MQDQEVYTTIQIHVPQEVLEAAKEKGISSEDAAEHFGDAIGLIVHERVIDEYQEAIIEDMLAQHEE